MKNFMTVMYVEVIKEDDQSENLGRLGVRLDQK